VNSRPRPSFWRLYGGLSEAHQKSARDAYALFAKDPSHPSLRFKKLAGFDSYWSVRINEQVRAVGERHGDTIEWFWIGTHNDFDNMF